MSPEKLQQYLPGPFHELLTMHEPPTELELDALLPDLLEKSVSLATGMVLALEATPFPVAPLLPMARVLTDYLTVAQKVFTVWNRRDMPRPHTEENQAMSPLPLYTTMMRSKTRTPSPSPGACVSNEWMERR